MKNTNETKTIKQKAKEVYLKNRKTILTVGGTIAVVGVGILIRSMTNKREDDYINQLEDDFQKHIEKEKELGVFYHIDLDGCWVLIVSETTDNGIKSMRQIAEDIQTGHYREDI